MKKITLIGAMLLVAGMTFGQQKPAANPALDSLRNEKDSLVLKEKISRLMKGNEKDLSLLADYYNRDAKKIEEIVKVAVQRFPEGNIAMTKSQNAIFAETDPAKQERLAEEFKKKFPKAPSSMVNFAVAYSYSTAKNIDKAKSFLSEVSDPALRSQATMMIANAISKYNLRVAEDILKPEIARVKLLQVTPNNVAPVDKETLSARKAALNNLLLAYTDLLILKKDYKAGYSYAKELYDNAEKKGPALLKNYYFLASKAGFYSEALPGLQDFYAKGQATEAMKEELKVAYTKIHPDKDVTAYMSAVSTDLNKKYQQEATQNIINEPAPNFTVTDATGKLVSLGDFKGKTIVLDFWATWCGPCKASFPAMQKAVTKYKNDNDVKFLFIHTWERNPEPSKDAKEYLSSNKYNFDLYMDQKNPSTGINPAVSAFGVKGIPAKFVIDGNGNIRFKVTGFSGGDDAAVSELSAMIETARSEKTSK